jgi:alkanesulfonate monooxygenase SsuD/methylene tetrahydromethanopterin reductase-like flavin-dependent oxidoreductase (luciferase family)
MLITVLADEKLTFDQIPEGMQRNTVFGSPEAIAEQIKTKVFDAGISGVIFNMPAYTPGTVAAVGEALQPVLPS